jgi:Spy/CpxP family protein refolding chaperone
MKTLSKRVKATIIAGTIIVVASMSSLAFAKYSDINSKAGWITAIVEKELSLTDEQSSKLEELKDVVVHAMETLKDENKDAKQEVQGFFAGDQFDREGALDFIGSKTDSVNRYAPDIINAIAGFHDSLSTEQKIELYTHLEQMSKHKHH